MNLTRNFPAVLILILLPIALLYPIFEHPYNWGVKDWDQHTFYSGVARSTITKFKQAPLWNPYYCGGNSMIGNPQSYFLSPFFIFILAFGEIPGMKIAVLAYAIAGMLGMYFLSRHFNFGKYSSLLPSIIFMLSSMFALHMTEGHFFFATTALIPFAFLAYLKSVEKNRLSIKFAVACSAVLSLMFFGGGVYISAYTSLLLVFAAIIFSLKEKSARFLKSILIIFIFFLGISSVKLLPVFEFTYKNPRYTSPAEGVDAKLLYNMFLNPQQSHTAWHDGQQYWWHEYGAYIGYPVALLLLLAFTVYFMESLYLKAIMLIFFLLMMGDRSPINLWGILHNFPVFSSLRIPSRFAVMVLFCASLIAGDTMSKIEKSKRIKKIYLKIFIIAFMIIITINLLWVSVPILKGAFPVTPLKPIKNELFQQTNKSYDYYSSLYPIFLENSGKVDCYEPVHIPISALPKESENYRGEAFLTNGGNASVSYFSPNKVVVQVSTTADGILALNQNYDSGWHANPGKAINYSGLVATDVKSSKGEITFYYMPVSFIAGLVITAAFIIISAGLLRK